MLVGDANARNTTMTPPASEYWKRNSFRCWDAQRSQTLPHPSQGIETGLDTYELPKKKCAGGLRAQIYFPT